MSIGVSGCVTSGTTYDRPKVITPQSFACSNGQHAKVKVYSPAEAVMGYGDKQYEMKRQETASGVKYAGQGGEFWSKGISAMITVDGADMVTCNAIPADASGEEDLTLPGSPEIPPEDSYATEATSTPPETYNLAPTPPVKPTL